MFDAIDPRSATPVDVQIARRIRLAIDSGEIAPGDALPSVRQLAGGLRINPAAVTQAYAALEREGFVELRHSAGAFIRRDLPASNPLARGAVDPGHSVRAVEIGPGDIIGGRFQVLDLLGSGGMGRVYRATDLELKETIAIKLLPSELLRPDGTSLERMRQEVRLARKISHPNILRMHDFGEADGTYFITMELATGSTVADAIKTRGRLSVADSIAIGVQLCEGLSAVHQLGIVHRDIKPQNLMIDPANVLKVMDFGIARSVSGAAAPGQALTATGLLLGTPDYMSPEQLLGEPLDGRTDLYACGAVLFECLTGRRVFRANTLAALVAAQIHETPPDPGAVNREIPLALAALILRALAKQPGDRFQDAESMRRALAAVA